MFLSLLNIGHFTVFLRSFFVALRCKLSELPLLVVLSQISFDGRTVQRI